MKKGILIWLLSLVLSAFTNYAFSPSSGETQIETCWAEATEMFQKLNPEGLSFEAFNMAFVGFKVLTDSYLQINDSILTIIDYSQSSIKNRLYVIDIKNQLVRENSLVAHGMNSGALYAESFSNEVESHKSSLGFYLTDLPYEGKHGYSLRLEGLESGINDNANARAIVMHGAHYASEEYISKYQRLGRSFGCPALPYSKNQVVIDLIRNKTCLFIYYPDKDYLTNSLFFKFSPYLKTVPQ